jgi:predicted TIM-barrel fold metal-dependent hydrolase
VGKYKGPVFDADNHYYEAIDAFTRHVPRKMHRRCVQVAEIGGKTRLMVAGKVDMQVGNPSFNPISKPGVLREFFRGNPDGKTMVELIRSNLEPMPAEYMDRDARIEVLAKQGLQAAWLFPTLGVLYEQPLGNDIEAISTTFEGFNRWLAEDWGLNYQNKLFSAPYIPLGDIDWACRELDWALKQGATMVCMRPAAVTTAKGRRSPSGAQFDPFWSRVNEAGITVVAHVANSGYSANGYSSGNHIEALGGGKPSVGSLGTERAIHDWFLTMIYDKLFERFPNLRLASVESGASYLHDIFKNMEVSKLRAGNYYKEDPVELFKRHCWINPFWEDDIKEVMGYMGADRVILGSDWPHMEGTSQPQDLLEEVEGISVTDQEKILFGNVTELNTLRPL